MIKRIVKKMEWYNN